MISFLVFGVFLLAILLTISLILRSIVDNAQSYIGSKLFGLRNEYLGRANAAFRDGKYEETIKWLNEGIHNYSTNFKLYNDRGNAKYQLGKLDEALIDFESSIKLCNNKRRNAKAFHNKEKTLSTIKVKKYVQTSPQNADNYAYREDGKYEYSTY